MHPTSPATAAPKLPTCIPTSYTDQAGHYCLAYPRSPWNLARYLVVRCPRLDESGAVIDRASAIDLECVHDDFGQLVPLRERLLTDDWASAAAWRPVKAGAPQ